MNVQAYTRINASQYIVDTMPIEQAIKLDYSPFQDFTVPIPDYEDHFLDLKQLRDLYASLKPPCG